MCFVSFWSAVTLLESHAYTRQILLAETLISLWGICFSLTNEYNGTFSACVRAPTAGVALGRYQSNITTSTTKAVLFRPKNKSVNENIHFKYGDTIIELVNCIKILGVTFSSNMLWNDRIYSVLGQLSRVEGTVYSGKTVLLYKVKFLLYKWLFCWHLAYCFLVWRTTTNTRLQKLYLMQKTYIRIIFYWSYDARRSELFQQAGIPPLHRLYDFKLALVVRRQFQESRHYLYDLSKLQPNNLFETWHKETWKIKTSRTNYSTDRLFYTVSTLIDKYVKAGIDFLLCTRTQLHDIHMYSFQDFFAVATLLSWLLFLFLEFELDIFVIVA